MFVTRARTTHSLAIADPSDSCHFSSLESSSAEAFLSGETAVPLTNLSLPSVRVVSRYDRTLHSLPAPGALALQCCDDLCIPQFYCKNGRPSASSAIEISTFFDAASSNFWSHLTTSMSRRTFWTSRSSWWSALLPGRSMPDTLISLLLFLVEHVVVSTFGPKFIPFRPPRDQSSCTCPSRSLVSSQPLRCGCERANSL